MLKCNPQYTGRERGSLWYVSVREGPGLSPPCPATPPLLLLQLLQTVEEKLPASTGRLCSF